MEFWGYYRVLRRKRWLIVVATVAALAVAFVTNRPTGGDFSATATLAVPTAQRLFFIAGASNAQGLGGPEVRTALSLSLIQSWEVAQRVIQRLDFLMTPAELQRRIKIEKGDVSNLIHVTVTGKTPLEAVTLANAVAETAADYDRELQRREVTLAREFLENQAEKVQTELSDAENSLLAFHEKNDAVLASASNTQIGNLEADLQRTDLALRVVDSRLSAILAQLGSQSPTRSNQQILFNPIVQLLRGQLVRLEVALTSELAVHTEKYPTVVALNDTIQAIKDRLSSEVSKTVYAEQIQHNPIYDALTQGRISLETAKVALLAEKNALQEVIRDAKRALPDLAQRQLEQSRLTRSVGILSGVHAKLQEQLTDSRFREQVAQNLESLTVADKAHAAIPSPFRGLHFRLTLAAVLGLLGGAGLAFFQEYLDTTLKTPENAERVLGMPVLVAVPRHNPPFDEAYRLLQVQLNAHVSREEGGGTVVVTSPKPQAGTSTVVANLSRAFARVGRRTIVVDAALPQPTQHVHFRVTNERGLADVLKGDAALPDVLVQTDVRNLWVLPSGAAPADMGELLSSRRMEKLLTDLKRAGEVILIDTPSVGVFADALSLVRLASGVLLVLDARHAPRGAQDQVKAQLDRLGANVIGVVLTKVRPDLVDSYVYQQRFYKAPSRRRFSVVAAITGVLGLLLAGLLVGQAVTSVQGGGNLPYMPIVAHVVARLISPFLQM